MQFIKLTVAVLLTTAALGLVACTQAPSDGMSGAAVGGGTEVAPGVLPTTESLPATEVVSPADSAPVTDAGDGERVVPDGILAAEDPKADGVPPWMRTPAPGVVYDADSDAAAGDSPDALGAGDPATLLAAHNRWRANFGSPPLTWNDELAAFAQDWANQMAAADNFAHRSDNRFGENLYGSTGTFSANSAVDAWGNEVSDYNRDTNTCAAGKACGHFTQVIWSRSLQVGCGKAKSATGWDYLVCNYDPPGNFTGQSPFAEGATTLPTAVPGSSGQPPAPTPRPTTAPQGSGAATPYSKTKTGINLAIPDAGEAATYKIGLTKSGTIDDLAVRIKILHPYVGDLSVKLVHPDGTEVMLRDQTGGNAQNIDQVFGRGGMPVAAMAALKGKPLAGDWKIVVQDHAEQDEGTLDSVKLDFMRIP